ncbi:MAG: hypothetical protein HQ527_02290 [Cyanobacteria bacterium]|nr:hypothetical protein [Cyanobacteria bacterium bin.51]
MLRAKQEPEHILEAWSGTSWIATALALWRFLGGWGSAQLMTGVPSLALRWPERELGVCSEPCSPWGARQPSLAWA